MVISFLQLFCTYTCTLELFDAYKKRFVSQNGQVVLLKWSPIWKKVRKSFKTLSELKVYLRYKTIFCRKVALDMWLINFFIRRKNDVLFSRYLDFCVFMKSIDLKICDVIIGIATLWKLHLCLFPLNRKYYQNEIWSNTSVVYDKHFQHVFGSMRETRN